MEIVKAAGAILSICSVIFSVLFVNLMNSAFLYENFFIKKYFFLNNYFQWNVLITEAWIFKLINFITRCVAKQKPINYKKKREKNRLAYLQPLD